MDLHMASSWEESMREFARALEDMPGPFHKGSSFKRSPRWVSPYKQRSVETPAEDGCCPICGGEPEECAELNSHAWIACRECGQDMRPEYGECIDCHVELPPVLRGSVERLALEGGDDTTGSEVAQVRKD